MTSMDFIDYPPPSPFKCPNVRMKWIILRGSQMQCEKIGEATYFIIDNSYHISNTQYDQFSQFSQDHQLRLLYGCNNKEFENELLCNACSSYKTGTTYYFCNKCNLSYHKECVESPPSLISPYHPKYPLQLVRFLIDWVDRVTCHSCGLETVGSLFYYSSICDLILDPVCARKREFPAINNPKRHEHMLHFLPRKASLTCDVCGLDDNKYCFYVCLQCDFVVHGTCINLPRIILIPYHNHRLSFTSSLPSGNWICEICRRKIDKNYGEYSCTKGCAYAVHSKCATRQDVWDGKELEDHPEMVYDNIKSFEEIGDGTIRHFSHAHHSMILFEDIERGVYDEKQHCQACMVPLYDGNVYRCMECDFTLHEACANLPCLKQNLMHPHWYILKPSDDTKSYFRCFSCNRASCGFKYTCCEGCEFCDLDVKCASLSELVDHQSHPHPLFFIHERGTHQTCSTCTGGSSTKSLNCVECDFSLCFRCATLPGTVKHEDDDHMLTLSYEKSSSSTYWCQVCEETLEPKKGYFACNECGVTFHIECTLRIDNPYVKAGLTIEAMLMKIEIIPNNHHSRLICTKCHKRCQYKVAYKTPAGNIICSLTEITLNTR